MCRSYFTAFGWVCVAAVLQGQAPQSDPPLVATNKVKNFRGKVVTVCGKVVTHACDTKTGVTTLDLDKPYWSKPAAVAIGREARRTFPMRPEDQYVGAEICATGVVERLDDRDVVRIDGSPQLVVKAAGIDGFGPGTVRPCDPDVEMPRVAREVKPNYTREAMEEQLQGFVFLEAVVLPDGSVGSMRPLVGFKPESGLNQSAMKALQQWKFVPGTASGRPAPVVVTVELSFRLK